MKKTFIVTIVLVVLVVISAIQTFQLINIRNQLASGNFATAKTTYAKPAAGASSGSGTGSGNPALTPDALKNAPSMVGGC